MKIVFRVDSSLQIGTGHVMRCLTLADALREHGAKCHFVCRALEGNLTELVTTRGHGVTRLPAPRPNFMTEHTQQYAAWLGVDWETDALETRQVLGEHHCNWLIVDHYALDYRWEQALRSRVSKIMVIDDLADRRHDCDLLLDQNLGRLESDYSGLLQSETEVIVGPHYALLRPEFSDLRLHSLARRAEPTLKRLLVNLGGVDRDNVTLKVLNALQLCKLPTEIEIKVILGTTSPGLRDIEEFAAKMPRSTQVLAGTDKMAQVMAESDLAIGAAGVTAWERCALGLPSIIIILAENQKNGGQALCDSGASLTLTGPEQIAQLLDDILNDARINVLKLMGNAAAKICDGKGTGRIVQKLVLTND